jgi:hypothetical protein
VVNLVFVDFTRYFIVPMSTLSDKDIEPRLSLPPTDCKTAMKLCFVLMEMRETLLSDKCRGNKDQLVLIHLESRSGPTGDPASTTLLVESISSIAFEDSYAVSDAA